MKRRKATSVHAVIYLLLAVACAVVLAPIVWALLTSFKTAETVVTYPPRLLPRPVSFEHYGALWKKGDIPRLFLNSLILSVGTIALSLFAATPAAYAAARLEFRGKHLILLVLLAAGMIPGICLLIPIYFFAARLRLLDSYFFMILVYSAWMIPQTIWYIKGFIEASPRALEEAARLDGCTVVGVMWRILMPIVRPGLSAISVVIFISVWNDFLIGYALTSQDRMRNVQIGLVRILQDVLGISWGQLMAYALVAAAPVLILFIFLERRFVAGLASGALKG